MKKPRFAILSGAGPMAGALLYQLVIKKLQCRGAWQDADFPSIILQNMPFSQMLSGDVDNPIVKQELMNCLSFLSQHADHVYIACQTLHAFLTDKDIQRFKVVSLLTLTQHALVNEKRDLLVVASKTTRRFNLHERALGRPCEYAQSALAERAIDSILKGELPDLYWLEELALEHPVILGCTEFSVAIQDTKAALIDPLVLAATDIVERFARSKKSTSPGDCV